MPLGCENLRQIVMYTIRDKQTATKIYTCNYEYAEQMSNKGYTVTSEIKKILG